MNTFGFSYRKIMKPILCFNELFSEIWSVRSLPFSRHVACFLFTFDIRLQYPQPANLSGQLTSFY